VREKGVGEDVIEGALESQNPKKALIRLLDRSEAGGGGVAGA
jgi:hypothetical protein